MNLRPTLLAAVFTAALTAPAAHAADRVTLSAGHVDAVAPALVDGGLALRVEDETGGGPAVSRDPDDVLFHVKPQAHMTVPAGLPPSFAFLGPAGSDVWILPQVQDPAVLWAGWSSEGIPAGTFQDDRLDWTLNRVDGPGPVQLYENTGVGEPRLFFDSADGLPDVERRPVGAHAHFNWVFHAPGTYTLNFSVAGKRDDGTSTVAYKEYRFFVGDLADLPPELLYIDGLEAAYDVGAEISLEAEQLPASRFTDIRWLESCGDDTEPRQVATGPSYRVGATRALDACRLVVALYDDAGRELLRSAEVLITIRSGHWGPRVIMSQGHADVLRVALAGGALKVAVKDDSGEAPVLRRPEDVLLHAKSQSRFLLTEELPPEFGFLGKPGETIYLLPEVQDPALLWPGWDTAEVPHGALTADELGWRLASVEGPGAVQVFGSDIFGLPRIIFDSADGLPDTSAMPAGTHVHANWAFSRPGLYRLRFELSGRPAAGGQSVDSGPLDYWFFVGDLADLPPYPDDDAPDPDPAPDDSAPPVLTQPATIAPAPAPATPAPRPTLRLTSAKLRGRVLTLGTRLSTRGRVRVTVRRGKRVVARARTQTVPATRRTLRVTLDRRLRTGRYRVTVAVEANGARVTRTIALRVVR